MNSSPLNSAAELLVEIRQRGIEVESSGDRLRYRPRSAMTRELAERIAAHKQALLALLGADEPRHSTWAGSVAELVATFPSPVLRCDLEDLFQETAGSLEYEQNLPRAEAEMQAFGLLLFRILELGIDARVVP